MMKSKGELKLAQKKIKPTAMRLMIYEILLKSHKAMSLFEIEQKFDQVDRSTIFRTIKTFQENCIIHSIDDGTSVVKYALCDEGCCCESEDLHIHFLCQSCKTTFCLKDRPIPKINLPDDFKFEGANFVIKGICPDCN